MQTVFVDRVPFKTELKKSAINDALAAIRDAGLEARYMRTRLSEFYVNGTLHQQAQCSASVFSSNPVRLVCSVRAALPTNKRPTLEACLELPNVLDLTKPLPQSVPVYAKPKSGNRYRMIHKPGHAHRTAQELVVLALSPAFVPTPFQFTHRGVPQAARAVRAAMEGGHVHCAHLDIKSFFASFDRELLAPELPLPTEVVEYAVVGRHMRVRWDQDRHGAKPPHLLPPHHLLLEARLGIPLGATSSPLVGMFCLSHLAWPVLPGVLLINYADDFLLLAASPDLLQQAMEALQAAVSILPGGFFVLNTRAVRKAVSGIDILGHRFTINSGRVTISPTSGNLQDLYGRMDALDTALVKVLFGSPINYEKGVKLLARFAMLIQGWATAFAECDRLSGYLDEPNHLVTRYMSQLRISADDLAAHVEPGDQYDWTGGY